MFQNISINERDFILEALKFDCRINARGLYDLRPIDIKYSSQQDKNGQVLVKFGRTKIITQSNLKLCAPVIGKPQEGFIKFNVDFNSIQQMAEFQNQTQTISEMKIEIQNFIEKIVKSSRVTDKEGLCIIQGKLVWNVTINLYLINDDGNLFDVFFLAAILAIKNTRLPEVSISKNKISINDEKMKYLNVHHIPICTTFYFIKDPRNSAGIDENSFLQKPILDVSSQEEKLCASRLSIVLNNFGDICGMNTLGALEFGDDHEDSESMHDDNFVQNYDCNQLLQYIQIALQKTREITKQVRSKWEIKDQKYKSIIDQELEKKQKRKKSKIPQENFLKQFNEQLEQNRISHPSAEDNLQLNESQLHDDKLIDLINQNDNKKKALLKNQKGVQDNANQFDQASLNLKNAILNQNDNLYNIRSDSLNNDLKEAAEKAREKKQNFNSILNEQNEQNLSLMSALKKKRNKK